MTVIGSEKNVEDLSLTFIAEFDAPVDRIWQLWEDPRQLERWWGARPGPRRSTVTTSLPGATRGST